MRCQTNHWLPVKQLIVTLLALIVSGCAIGPTFEKPSTPKGDNALVYVYRPFHPGGLAAPSLFVNYEDVASLPTGGYLKVEIPNGDHRLTFGSGGTGTVYEFESGKTYYFKVLMTTKFRHGYDHYVYHLKKINQKSAIREIKKTRLSKDLGFLDTSVR